MGLGSSLDGNLTTTFFAGAVYNLNQINLYVQVYDNDKAIAVYRIESSIIVVPDFTNIETTMNQLIAHIPNFSTNIILYEGSYLLSLEEIQRISSLLNQQSLSDKIALILNRNESIFPQTFGPLNNFTGVTPVS